MQGFFKVFAALTLLLGVSALPVITEWEDSTNTTKSVELIFEAIFNSSNLVADVNSALNVSVDAQEETCLTNYSAQSVDILSEGSYILLGCVPTNAREVQEYVSANGLEELEQGFTQKMKHCSQKDEHHKRLDCYSDAISDSLEKVGARSYSKNRECIRHELENIVKKLNAAFQDMMNCFTSAILPNIPFWNSSQSWNPLPTWNNGNNWNPLRHWQQFALRNTTIQSKFIDINNPQGNHGGNVQNGENDQNGESAQEW